MPIPSSHFLWDEAFTLLSKGAIETVPVPAKCNGFYSIYFAVPSAWLGSIDLQDTYFYKLSALLLPTFHGQPLILPSLSSVLPSFDSALCFH